MSGQTILSYFSLILFVLMVGTGIIWFLDVFHLSKQRRLKADQALAEFDARNERLKAEGIKRDESGRAALEANLLRQPTWIEYSGSFFPVIALVFFVRSFLYEPFKIPSASMEPTLESGDFILVNKYAYGIRLPIINKTMIHVGDPQRGDVMVFRYPEDPSTNYIKRVVGVPGDKIVYKNKHLTINGKKLAYQPMADFLDDTSLTYIKQFSENLNGVQHRILNLDNRPAYVPDPDNFPQRELCTYDIEGFA
ncbi:MAG: signal peptidase I, partial [Burkholderiaceae bacterium]|nr:signal peptidase I [Burkholderiaceae bacterium]